MSPSQERRTACICTNLCQPQRLIQVPQNAADVFQSHAQPHKVGRHPGRGLLVRVELAVYGADRVLSYLNFAQNGNQAFAESHRCNTYHRTTSN